MGTVVSLCIQPAPSIHEPPYRYNRVPVQSANLIAGHGIEGDLKAGHNSTRQINIMSAEIMQDLGAEGYRVGPGEMGEQIVVRGIDLGDAAEGTVLRLGTAQIVLDKPRTGCEWFELIQGLPRATGKGQMGWMAHVAVSGVVRTGDPVDVVKSPVSQQDD